MSETFPFDATKTPSPQIGYPWAMSAMPIGRDEASLVLPEAIDFLLEAVAVGIGEQVDVAVVGQGDELAVGAVLDVVDVRQSRRATPAAEKPGTSICTGGGFGDGDQRLAGVLTGADG